MTNAWIFQATPNRFRIDDYLESKPTDSCWLANQYRNEISPGDTAYIWRAQGRVRARRGILAKATVTSIPYLREDHPSARTYWVNPKEEDQKRMRVEIRFSPKRTFISREAMLADDILKSVSILSFDQATNFPVTPDQADRIESMW